MTLLGQRLWRQRLVGSTFAAPDAIVSWLGAMQAQDFAGVCWSVAQRTRSLGEGDVLAAFDAGDIIRAHVLRPTWHFVATQDLRWMLSITAPRVQQQNAAQYRKHGLDLATRKKTRAAIARALRGQCLHRQALALQIGENPHGNRLVHVLMDAELEGIICSGPRVGKQHTYALIDERIPPTPAIRPEEAIRMLALVYFRSRGPAQIRDFAWWANLTLADARCGIERAGLTSQLIEGRVFWRAPGRSLGILSEPSVCLLPSFDEFVISYRDRTDFQTSIPANGPLLPRLVLVDGKAVGTWAAARTARKLQVTLKLQRKFLASERRTLDESLDRYRVGLGRHLVLELEQSHRS